MGCPQDFSSERLFSHWLAPKSAGRMSIYLFMTFSLFQSSSTRFLEKELHIRAISHSALSMHLASSDLKVIQTPSGPESQPGW